MECQQQEWPGWRHGCGVGHWWWKANRSTSRSRQWPKVRRSGENGGGGWTDNRPDQDGRYGTLRNDGGGGRSRFFQENPHYGSGTSDGSRRSNAGGSRSGWEGPLLLLGAAPDLRDLSSPFDNFNSGSLIYPRLRADFLVIFLLPKIRNWNSDSDPDRHQTKPINNTGILASKK
jgi:hypothetical protein